VVCIPPDLPLFDDARLLLSKGLTFVPLRQTCDRYSLIQDMERFFRTLRLQFFFSNSPSSSSPFSRFVHRKSPWTPKSKASIALDLYIKRTLHEVKRLRPQRMKFSTLIPCETRALNNLRRRLDITIKPADNGSAVVVWRKDLYIYEGKKQLPHQDFYRPSQDNITLLHNQKVKSTITDLISRKRLSPSASNLIIPDSAVGKPSFYLLP
jgi:hypothetical protein